MKGGNKIMGNVKIDKSTQVFLVLGMTAMLVFAGMAAFKEVSVTTPAVDVDEEAIAQLVIGSIVLPSDNASSTNDKLDEIYDEMFKEDEAEDIAEKLALDELETKDFKKDLIKFLMDKEPELQGMDYKDIEDVVVRDIDVEVVREDAKVEVEFKVYVSNFGDEDEEEKARVSAVFYIEDLDEDDDYEDAEVGFYDYEFDLVKFYD